MRADNDDVNDDQTIRIMSCLLPTYLDIVKRAGDSTLMKTNQLDKETHNFLTPNNQWWDREIGLWPFWISCQYVWCCTHQSERVLHDLDIVDGAKLWEILTQVVLLRLPGETTNKQFDCMILMDMLS